MIDMFFIVFMYEANIFIKNEYKKPRYNNFFKNIDTHFIC